MAAFVVAAKRTPFGTFGGKLTQTSATELAAHASKAAIASIGLDPKLVDSVVIGNVAHSSTDAIYLARHVGLMANVPKERPSLVVNRLCGSGFEAVVQAAKEIRRGESNIVLAGGTENMSQSPYNVRDIRFGTKLGAELKLEDYLWAALTDSHCKMPMGLTAENLGEKYGITREECDQWALTSLQRWAAANASGKFKEEIAPITLKGKKGPESFEVDEHPKPNSTLEILSKLPPVFKKGGIVTAGNASGICDGAAALVIASEKAVKQHNLKPLARVVSWASVGVDPSIMGFGPVPSIRAALEKANLKLSQIDLIDINEAFAAQFLACAKALELDMNKVNPNGGAVAVGHPLGATGARISTNIVYELRRQRGKYAVGSACIGGGQGIAIVFENTN